jgi:hypothetical protein
MNKAPELYIVRSVTSLESKRCAEGATKQAIFGWNRGSQNRPLGVPRGPAVRSPPVEQSARRFDPGSGGVREQSARRFCQHVLRGTVCREL